MALSLPCYLTQETKKLLIVLYREIKGLAQYRAGKEAFLLIPVDSPITGQTLGDLEVERLNMSLDLFFSFHLLLFPDCNISWFESSASKPSHCRFSQKELLCGDAPRALLNGEAQLCPSSHRCR